MATTPNDDPGHPSGDGKGTNGTGTSESQPGTEPDSGKLRRAGRRMSSASVAGLRALMPAIELYAGRRANAAGEASGEPGKLGLLTVGEEAVLLAAGRKAFAETLTITTRSHGLPGTEPYDAGEGGDFRPPSLRQLYSLVAAAKGKLDHGRPDDEPEPEPAPTGPAVAYLAVAPGEYQVVEGPITPTQARRSAMRQRTFAPPPPAALASSTPRFQIVPASPAAGQAAMMAGSSRSLSAHGGQAAYRARTAYAPAAQGGYGSRGEPMVQGGCARCGGSRSGWTFPPAQYEEDGDCKSVFSISCDTRWRLRECLKVSFCELLRCLGEELCEDGVFSEGERDLGRCLEGFVCTLIGCLPEAICPPPAPGPCCLPGDALSCGCNFAVGE